VFWDREKNDDIRVIFRLADFSFEDSAANEDLENALKKALDSEDYEHAALLRDEINNKKKNAGNNIK
jgi:hypothetical protein